VKVITRIRFYINNKRKNQQNQ